MACRLCVCRRSGFIALHHFCDWLVKTVFSDGRAHVLTVGYGMARLSEDIEYDVLFLKGKEQSHADFYLGIDIGKNSCSVVGVDDRGAVVVRRTMRRQTLIEFVERLPRYRDGGLLWCSPSWPALCRERP